MPIVFACGSCGSRFEVADRFAGKTGRCKHCGARMTIPSPPPSALRLAPAMPGAVRPASARSRRPPGWIDAVTSQVGLAPLSAPALAPVSPARRENGPLDDASFTGRYPVRSQAEGRPVTGSPPAAGAALIFYRQQLGRVQRLLRWISDADYLVSIPFLMLMLLGVMLRSRPLAVTGATLVVLLNFARLAVGLANLVVIPFRDSPVQGVLFLIPPLTFLYIANHYHRLRRPFRRVSGPLLTIGGVVLVFAFVPWMTRNGPIPEAGVSERLKAGVEELRGDLQDEIRNVPEIPGGGLERNAADALKGLTSPSPGVGAEKAAGALRGAIEKIQSARPGASP